MQEIRLLGGVAVRQQGRPATTSATRALGLLAYLVLHGEVQQSRLHLAGTFWPDSGDAQARTNLRRELHQLRALLIDDECLVADATTLAWQDRAQCQVDVRMFLLARRAAVEAHGRGDLESLVRHGSAAVDAYHGPLLPGWYDDWVLEARQELERTCIDLCDRVVASAKQSLDSSRVMPFARRRIQLAPLEEAGYRQLMQLQAALGDRAGAMTTYHRCASILEEELGLRPSLETNRAIETIIGEGAGMRSGVASLATGDEPAIVGSTLVGREPEVAALHSRWELAASGSPGIALVLGEPGVGKTRLAKDLATALTKQGVLVASARCFGSSGRLALAPVAEWLRSPQLRGHQVNLEKVWCDEVDRLVPSTSTNSGGAIASRAKVDAWQRLRFFEGLARAVLIAQQPTLLVLDDLHWCDNDTMLWLAFLLDLAAGAPLLVLTTAREDELAENSDVLGSLRSMRSAGMVSEILLGPLSAADTAGVAAQMLGRVLPAEDLSLLQSATGGYPLYVVEAIRNLPTDQPYAALNDDDLSRVLQQRLANAPEPARAIAGLAAAVGRDFTLDLLSEASDLDADSVVRAVDALWRRRILRQSGSAYDFTHDLLRDTAYRSVRPAQQWLHHRRLAQAIELLHADQLDAVAAQLAHHYDRSGRADRALPFYARAAEAASKVFANAEAVRLLRLSLELVGRMPPGRDRDLRELETLQAISAPLNALHGYAAADLESALSRSVELAERLGEDRVLLASLVGLWASRLVQGEIGESHRTAARALVLSTRVPDLAGQAEFAIAGSLQFLGQLDVAVAHFDVARELSRDAVSLTVGTRPEVHAQAWEAHALWLLGDVVGAEAACREAIRRAREVQHPYSLAVALAYAGITYQMSGNLVALDATLDELSELCGRYDIAYYREWAVVLSGWRLGGRRGISRIRTGLARLTSERSLVRMPYWLSLLADLLHSVGDLDAARAAIDAGRVAAVQRDDLWWLPEVLRSAARHQSYPDAVKTLQRAAELAASQSSAILLKRCQDDLALLDVVDPTTGVRDVT